MSLKGIIRLTLVFSILLCDISLFVTSHSVHHTRSGHHYPNPYYRHSHYHNQHLLHQRSSKRVRTGLDQLMEKLNVTDDYHSDGDNNLDSSLNLDNFSDNNETVTTERWKPSTTLWQTDVYNKPEGGYDEDVNNEDNPEDDEEDEEIESEERKDSTMPVNTQSDSENGYRSPMSDYKWKNMANRADLDKIFQSVKYGGPFRQTPEDSFDQSEAVKHTVRMSRETSCKVPRPKVIKVADHYPSSGKYYAPQCTILHQCSEETGCCKGNQKCAPKKSQQVILYFNTVTYIFRGQTRMSTSQVEKLKFYNHTECECVDEDMPRDSALRPIDLQRPTVPENNCRCPSEYSVRHLASGQCICDCFDKQRDCIKYKKGKEYFNHRDRLCIEMETCLPPSCDFGMYNRRSGRCPRKHEKFRTWSSRFTKN